MGKEKVSMTADNPAVVQTVQLLERRWLSQNAFEIELSRPPSFDFEAGHTILLIHQSIKRHYSLISTRNDTNLTLCVYFLPEGRLSSVLAGAEIGFQLKMTGPHGYFTFRPSNRLPVFVATGTGIAPFISFARSGITDFTLFHLAVSADELYYQSYFNTFTPNYFPCLSQVPTAGSSIPNLFCGRMSRCIRENLRSASYDFYLCGERETIRDVTLLVDEFYPDSRVYTEVFF